MDPLQESTSTIDHAPAPASVQATAPTVGVFDSGVGGFTVARAILALRPDINLVYFGDNLNMPYGGRKPEQLARFARNSIEFLLQQGIDILAVGCNASNSVLGQGELRSFGLPVFDLVSSTIEALRARPEPPAKLAIIATVATINTRYWQRKLTDAFPELKIGEAAAPEFVPLIEAAEQSAPAQRAAVRKYLLPLMREGYPEVLHGCTHYPLLEDLMRQEAPDASFLDPAACLAQQLTGSLEPAQPGAGLGQLNLFSSLPSERFYAIAERALGRAVREYTRMYIVNPHED
jgi:glutamate racemase